MEHVDLLAVSFCIVLIITFFATQYFIVFMKGRSHQRYIFKVIFGFCINFSGLEHFQRSVQIVDDVTALQTTFFHMHRLDEQGILK